MDFDKRTIHISRTLYRDVDRNVFVEGPPKTETSDRIIPLTDRAYEILFEKKRNKGDENKIIPFTIQRPGSDSGHNCNYIFTNSKGKPIYLVNLNNALKKIADQIGIERLSMHSLRHTFATRCIEAGMRPKTLQKLMGHSSIQITMDIYVHVTDDEIRSEMNKLELVVV